MISNLLPSKGKGAQLLFGAPAQFGCSWSMSTPVRKIVKNSSSVPLWFAGGVRRQVAREARICQWKPHHRFGLFTDGCPNLLLELMRTRRELLPALQLMRENPTEAIVDKDSHNHAFAAEPFRKAEIDEARRTDRVSRMRHFVRDNMEMSKPGSSERSCNCAVGCVTARSN